MIKIIADIPKALLSQALSIQIDNVIKEDKLDFNGFDVKIARIDEPTVNARKQSIFVDLPLDITIYKDAGLFSIEAVGSLLIGITINADISHDLNLSTKSEISSWKWIEEPKVKLGVLNIPVASVANLVLHRVEEKIANQMDTAIAKNVDLQSLINQKLASIIDSKQISKDPELFLRAQLEGIKSPGFLEYTDKIEFPLYLDIQNHISDHYEASTDWDIPPFEWLHTEQLEYTQEVNLALHYNYLEELIQSKIDGLEIGGKSLSTDEVKISYENQLKVIVKITSPIESTLTITGHPRLDNGSLHLDDLEVDMDTPSLLYKMTAPIVEKLIRSNLEDKLPVKIQEITRAKAVEGLAKANQSPLLNIKLPADHIDINELSFEEDQLVAQATVQDLELKLLLENAGSILSFII